MHFNIDGSAGADKMEYKPLKLKKQKKKDDRSLGYFEKWTEQKIWHGTESCEYHIIRIYVNRPP